METENKRKLKFNVIDVIIVVMILACIAGIVVRYTVIDQLGGVAELDSYYIEFESTLVSYSATEAFNSTVSDVKGENWVYLRDGVTAVGEMTLANSLPSAEVYIKGENNEIIKAQYADVVNDKDYITYTVSGNLLCQGFVSSETGSFMLNGNIRVAAGTELEVQTKYGDFTLKVTKITQAKETE